MVSTYQKKQGTAVPWSWSSLQAYETCPRRFYLTRITKAVSEPQSDATMYGNQVHQALEQAGNGTKALPEKFKEYNPLIERVRAATGKKLYEFKFGLTKDLRPAEFFGHDVWVRGVLDVGIVRPKEGILLDWKTGKRKFDGDQLKLFAMAGLSLWPHVERVKTGYVWLQSGNMDQEVFARKQQTEIYQEFSARVHRMEISEKNNDWPARPSGLCKAWCPVGKTNCEHCGK